MEMKIILFAFVLLFFQGITYDPPDVDHAKIIRSLNNETLKKGKEIYTSACQGCHGKDGTASLPQARSFGKDQLRFGNSPYEMWKTITNGAGMMAAQTWLNPAERYYAIQYIREEFIKKTNKKQYFKITDEYLATLPKSEKTVKEQLAETKRQALKGSLKYGQDWFMNNKSDYGYAIHSQLKDHSTSAINVLLDNDIILAYDLLRMGTTAAWQGKLNVIDTKYKRYRGEGEPFIQGNILNGLQLWQWSYNGTLDSMNKITGVREPLPADKMNYLGHYAYGKKTVLSYSISGRNILEHPSVIINDKQIILSQLLKMSAGEEQEIYIGQLTDSGAMYQNGTLSGNLINAGNYSQVENNTLFSKSFSKNILSTFIAAKVISPSTGFRWKIDGNNRMVLVIPSSEKEITVEVLRTQGKNEKELQSFAHYSRTGSTGAISFSALTNGGPALWNKKIITQGQINASRPHFDPKYFEDEDKTAKNKLVKLPDDYPYTVDNIALPFNNPYNAWVRPTALGFMKDGRIIISTYSGDIWMGSGIDDLLNNITWQRIASGLYEPMGIKIINDKIHVTCRNGIIILNDLNDDNETDFYQTFHADHDVSSFFHAFNFGLETDTKGNFYYVKPGQYTDNKDPGNVIKVSPDGKKWESLATGFRVNNGITITPDDRIFVSDNQGNWTPANKINVIKKGKYYGYVGNVVENGWSPNGIKYAKTDFVNGVLSAAIIHVPDTFEQPALWMPQEFDNSPGGGVWSPQTWGPLGNHFIHTSYGTGWMYYFLPHEVEEVTQGAMVAMPFQFDAGIQRAAVNPVDQQVYVTGLTGWDDGVSTKYGVLSRVRYTGKKGHLLEDAEIVKEGVKLSFNFRADNKTATDTSSYNINRWNYHRTNKYGSAHYSLTNPAKTGEDMVTIDNITISEDRRSVLLSIKDLRIVNTMRIRLQVKAEDGTVLNESVYLTINKIPE